MGCWARHGHPGICDLITINETGLTVTDYKTKLRMEAQYADRELRETQRSWQLLQYAWFVELKYGVPVTQIRKLLVTFGPTLKVWLVSYPLTSSQLSSWYRQAVRVWESMDTMEHDDLERAWQNEQSCERYGWIYRCGFYHRCWEGEA